MSEMFDKRAIFLDRDGAMIDAVHRPDFHKPITAPFNYSELRFVPRVNDVLNYFEHLGFMTIMITNQPDVALGYAERSEWNKIHSSVINYLELDDFYMCRHTSDQNCPCKKPLPGMLITASDKWGIDLNSSYMVGDTIADIGAGKAAGCKTVLIRKFYNIDCRGVADIEIDELADLMLPRVDIR